MQNALMVGYTKVPYTFEHLSSILDDKKSVELNTIKHSEIVGLEIYRSYHDRKFEWMKNKGEACEIELTHLWLPTEIQGIHSW